MLLGSLISFYYRREAWSALGEMSKETAMKTYVDEMLKVMLKQVIPLENYTPPCGRLTVRRNSLMADIP